MCCVHLRGKEEGKCAVIFRAKTATHCLLVHHKVLFKVNGAILFLHEHFKYTTDIFPYISISLRCLMGVKVHCMFLLYSSGGYYILYTVKLLYWKFELFSDLSMCNCWEILLLSWLCLLLLLCLNNSLLKSLSSLNLWVVMCNEK